MDDLFSVFVHHGGYFTDNPQEYVGSKVDVVNNCDPDKWSKVVIEGICRDFGYTFISRLWYKMLGKDQERDNFHLIVDDHDAMFMTDLVRGHEEIHVFVEHLGDDPILVNEGEDIGEDVQPLAVKRAYKSPIIEEVDEDDVVKVVAKQVYSRRAGKEHSAHHPSEVKAVSDSSDSVGGDSGGSGLENETKVIPDKRVFVEDNSDSWDGKDEDDDVVESGQMGAGIMNSDYESEELHSLDESSSDDEIGDDSDDNFEDELKIPGGKERGHKLEKKRTFPVFKPVAKAEHIIFEKDMLFTAPKAI
nr:hypothetical protein CFP56_40988 [Quercus suber]POE61384.1 hypothetical protein CFP56_40989 [Quercus suber]